MLRCVLAGVLVFTLADGCAHTHWCDSTCQKRAPDLVTAVQVAGIAVHKMHGWSPPADFDAKAYLAAARAYPLLDWQVDTLESVELEVWVKDDCRGAIVIARCPKTKRVILVDDTVSTSRVDQPNLLANPEAQAPVRPSPPPTCASSPRP